jgi:hypothetical protein
MPDFRKTAPACFLWRQTAIRYIVETDDWTEKRSKHIGESVNNRTEYHVLIQG